MDPVPVVQAVYTAPEVLTFIAAIGVLITGLLAGIVNIVVALRTGTKLDAAAAKTDGLVSDVRAVHVLTNSNLSAVKAELTTANAAIIALRDLVTDLRAEREKASIASALATTIVPTPPADPTLAAIRDNTADTVDAIKDQKPS